VGPRAHEAAVRPTAREQRGGAGPGDGALAASARQHQLVLNVSVHERVEEGPGRGTLYNTMLTLGPDGSLLNRHRVADLPPELELVDSLKGRPDELVLNGGSAIIAPDGSLLAGPVWGQEQILTADLDFTRIAEESLTLDVTGHYHRPDIFDGEGR
jgi:predicted amidohydrolase